MELFVDYKKLFDFLSDWNYTVKIFFYAVKKLIKFKLKLVLTYSSIMFYTLHPTYVLSETITQLLVMEVTHWTKIELIIQYFFIFCIF